MNSKSPADKYCKLFIDDVSIKYELIAGIKLGMRTVEYNPMENRHIIFNDCKYERGCQYDTLTVYVIEGMDCYRCSGREIWRESSKVFGDKYVRSEKTYNLSYEIMDARTLYILWNMVEQANIYNYNQRREVGVKLLEERGLDPGLVPENAPREFYAACKKPASSDDISEQLTLLRQAQSGAEILVSMGFDKEKIPYLSTALLCDVQKASETPTPRSPIMGNAIRACESAIISALTAT